jgi:hypothetical protein
MEGRDEVKGLFKIQVKIKKICGYLQLTYLINFLRYDIMIVKEITVLS